VRELNIEPIRAVERTVDILDAFTLDQPAMTIEQIMRKTRLPRATVYRLLYTLERRGLIRYDRETLEYRLGFHFLQYSNIVASSLNLVKEAEEVLADIHVKTRQTVLMSVLEDGEMVYVFKREIPTGLKFSSSVGERRPLSYGALGRVLLAFQPEERIAEMLSRTFPQYTPQTVTDPAAIRQQLERIRKERVFHEAEQTILGVTAIAAPVFGSDGRAIAAIGLVFPSAQMTDDQKREAADMIRGAARVISERIGYREHARETGAR